MDDLHCVVPTIPDTCLARNPTKQINGFQEIYKAYGESENQT